MDIHWLLHCRSVTFTDPLFQKNFILFAELVNHIDDLLLTCGNTKVVEACVYLYSIQWQSSLFMVIPWNIKYMEEQSNSGHRGSPNSTLCVNGSCCYILFVEKILIGKNTDPELVIDK